MTEQQVLIEQEEEALFITLNRPERSNALSPTMVETLIDTFDGQPSTRAVVLRGNGPNFCAGFDLSDIPALSDGDLLLRFVRIEQMLQLVHHAPFPVLALGKGHIVGAGADLFAACSDRVVATNARLKMPGWNFGLALGTRRLAQLIGADAARMMLIDTKTVDAEEAVRFGLTNEILKEHDWNDAIARFTASSLALSKQAVDDMMSLTTVDTRSEDLAALVRTAGRPGLKSRVLAYQERLAQARAARNVK